MHQLILFDLDGTLVDTAPDLGHALNMQLERHGKPTLSMDMIRPVASHGSKGLLALGFGLTPDHADFDKMRIEYLSLYDEVFTRSPVLFDGMQEVLNNIESRNLKWGIVTNKPRRFTEPLVKAMELYDRAATVICGDDATKPKPSPETLFMACDQTKVAISDAIYIGDAERDIQAGQAAGMKTVVAMYGYLDTNDHPENWSADYFVQQPLDILKLI
ncbi:MAG TPA: HAD-IA family hydrolase [Methylophilaceae bacterium]